VWKKFLLFWKDCFRRETSLKLEAAKQDGSNGTIAFDLMCSAFDRAWKSHAGRRWNSWCRFAGRPARIRVVGQGLAEQIGQAFQHLLIEENSSSAELKIDLWDEGETSVSCPVNPEPVEPRVLKTTSYVEFGLILGSLHDPYIGCQRPDVVTWFNRQDQHIVGWIFHHRQLAIYERGKPLHFPLLLWHSDRGSEVIHAALVSKNGKGVLFGGKGGVGKSTVALACVEGGFDYLGDDYIGLEACEDDRFVGHSLYSTTWLMADHLPRFPRLIGHALSPERPREEKTLALLSEVFPGQLSRSAPICALVLPRIVAASSIQIKPATRAEALFALAPSSIVHRPHSGAATLNKLTRLAEQVPCYWLELTEDLDEIPQHVMQVIDSLQPNSSVSC
jgi:hypothetical protein